jgi:hypothetical protein
MNYINKIILLPLLVFSLFGCKFYYSSTDINKKLKTSLDNINSNCDKLSGQIKTYQTEYLKLNCANSTSEQKKALSMFQEINVSLNEIGSFRQLTNDEYGKFLLYTKGNDKIQSGTPEWKSFKNTKKKFKTALKSIQNIGNATVNKAEDLNKLVSEQIAPKIQKCVVADYKKSIKSAVDSLSKLEQELALKINEYTNKINLVLKTFQSSFPEKCQDLNTELAKMKDVSKELSSILSKVNGINRDFSSKTKGVEYIYSCSSDWNYIMKVEQEIKNEQSNLNNLKMKMQTIQNQIQVIVNQMKQ